jgi:hypothetical protein
MCHKVVAAQLTQKSYDHGVEPGTKTNVHAGTEQQNETQQEANDNEVDFVVASSNDGVAGDEAMAGTTPVAPLAEDYGTCFTLEDQKQIELLKMLNDAHAPHYTYLNPLTTGPGGRTPVGMNSILSTVPGWVK